MTAQKCHGGRQHEIGIARQVAFHRRPSFVPDATKSVEDAGEIEVASAGFESLRIGEMDVGEHLPGFDQGPAHVGLLDVHVEHITHRSHVCA